MCVRITLGFYRNKKGIESAFENVNSNIKDIPITSA